jgi:hypothetical protein
MHIYPYIYIYIYMSATSGTNNQPATGLSESVELGLGNLFAVQMHILEVLHVCVGGLAGPQGEREWERISLRGVLHTVFVWVSRHHHTLKHASSRTLTHTHIQIHTRSHTHSHIHTHIHTHTHMHMQIQFHIHTASHSRFFTHTHTQHMHVHTH